MSLNKLFCTIFIVCAISQVYSYRIERINDKIRSERPITAYSVVPKDPNRYPSSTTPVPKPFTPQPPRRRESRLGKAYRDWGNFKYNLADGYDSLLRGLGKKNPTIIGGLLRLCGKYTHDYADYIDNYYG